MQSTRDTISELYELGLSTPEIARQLDLAPPTVSYHVERLAAAHARASESEAVRRGAVVARPNRTPLAELLIAGTYRGRYHLKLRLISEGLKENRCERCGISDWRGEPLTMALHHVNGERNDNRLENLELLCPNCHSQTDTFAGRNGRSRPDRPELVSP